MYSYERQDFVPMEFLSKQGTLNESIAKTTKVHKMSCCLAFVLLHLVKIMYTCVELFSVSWWEARVL